MDKSWIQIQDRGLHQYVVGVTEFIEFASEHMEPGVNTIQCPCIHCNNCEEWTLDQVESHLLAYGMVKGYTKWVFHGDQFESSSNDDDDNKDSDNEEDEDNDEVQEILHDMYVGTCTYDRIPEVDTRHIPVMHDDFSGERDKFTRLMKEAEQELYPGCKKFSKLSFIVNLLHLKLLNQWSNKSFTMLLDLLKDAFPVGETLPSSHYQAKKIIRDLGLDYEKIHVCKNDCVLFWKEYEDKDKCPKCKTPRYKFDNGKGKKVPHKILRYFPLKPRLQRLFISKKTAEDMRWHKDKRVDDGVLRHPADSESWKDFDQVHKSFAADSRNVRLGLASDGFNPFGNMDNSYSMWPVFIVPYNLPPWKCMKDPFLMMSLLIPGRRAPGIDIDVYLQPLISELKELWNVGVETFDAYSGQHFQLHAAVLWTINDFPAYGDLSGWSTKGKLACPTCNEDASHRYLDNWKKTCYLGHRRFLPDNHKLRKSKAFDGEVEDRLRPKILSGDDVCEQLKYVEQPTYGKVDENGKKRKRSPSFLNWKKRSVFFDLPYWRTLKLRHNLDVMHIEKNICDSVLGTLMNIKGKTKDSYKARLDLEAMDIRHELHPRVVDGETFLPPACYTLTTVEKRGLCEFLSSVKFPDGYASNISQSVSINDCRITGLKSHDSHIILQQLLPIALRGYLRKDVREALMELSLFFKELTSKTLQLDVLDRLDKEIVLILCKLEKILPPSFFDVMVHLSVHLAREAMLGGPVQYRWMYRFERYMHNLKGYVRNKARPEGSIAEGYIDNECLTFCSMYLHGVETKFNRVERNYDGCESQQLGGLFVFSQKARGLGAAIYDELDLLEFEKARWYVLNNCEEAQPYRE